MHVDRVDLSAIQPMDVGATLPSDGCPQLRERHGPFHSTPPLVGSKRGIRNEHGRLDFRPFLNERGFPKINGHTIKQNFKTGPVGTRISSLPIWWPIPITDRYISTRPVAMD